MNVELFEGAVYMAGSPVPRLWCGGGDWQQTIGEMSKKMEVLAHGAVREELPAVLISGMESQIANQNAKLPLRW